MLPDLPEPDDIAPSGRAPRGMSARFLVTLVLVVLAAHVVLLAGVPGRILVPAHGAAPAWTARTLVLAPTGKQASSTSEMPHSGAPARVAALTARPSIVRAVSVLPPPELTQVAAAPPIADETLPASP